MVVEDNAEFRNLVEDYLKNTGFETVACEDGSKIVDYLLKSPVQTLPEVIIMDLRMPNMNGMEFLRITHGLKIRPPVIIMTSFGTFDIHKEAALWGAYCVLNKPFPLEDLLEKINEILETTPACE